MINPTSCPAPSEIHSSLIPRPGAARLRCILKRSRACACTLPMASNSHGLTPRMRHLNGNMRMDLVRIMLGMLEIHWLYIYVYIAYIYYIELKICMNRYAAPSVQTSPFNFCGIRFYLLSFHWKSKAFKKCWNRSKVGSETSLNQEFTAKLASESDFCSPRSSLSPFIPIPMWGAQARIETGAFRGHGWHGWHLQAVLQLGHRSFKTGLQVPSVHPTA